MDWQPIETAPKDGTTVLVFYKGSLEWMRGRTYGGDWQIEGHSWIGHQKDAFTHWMPLPSPPRDRGETMSEVQAAIERMGSCDPSYFPVYPGGQKQFDADCQVLAADRVRLEPLLADARKLNFDYHGNLIHVATYRRKCVELIDRIARGQ